MIKSPTVSAIIPADQPFVPIITQGDLGAYSWAREFHEAYGVNSVIVPTNHNLVVGGSKITQVHPAGKMFDGEKVVNHLLDIAKELEQQAGKKRPLPLLVGYDHLVRIGIQHQDVLEAAGYLFPELTEETFDAAALKENFYALCDQLGVKYPRTKIFHGTEGTDTIAEFVQSLEAQGWQYPLILKSDDGGAWANTNFDGRRKVHFPQSGDELTDVMTKAVNAGYVQGLVIQEFIPGPDSNLRILSIFRDRNGNNVLTGNAEVIVEDHTPGLEGNSRALVVVPDEHSENQGRMIMDALNWQGFAMFDIKVHEQTGEPYFLEMNPRLGRHHYYLTAAGGNPANYIVREFIERTGHGEPKTLTGPAMSTTIPLNLARKYANTQQLEQIRAAKEIGTISWPLQYKKDRNFKRDLYQRYRLTKAKAEVDHIPGTMNN